MRQKKKETHEIVLTRGCPKSQENDFWDSPLFLLIKQKI